MINQFAGSSVGRWTWFVPHIERKLVRQISPCVNYGQFDCARPQEITINNHQTIVRNCHHFSKIIKTGINSTGNGRFCSCDFDVVFRDLLFQTLQQKNYLNVMKLENSQLCVRLSSFLALSPTNKKGSLL